MNNKKLLAGFCIICGKPKKYHFAKTCGTKECQLALRRIRQAEYRKRVKRRKNKEVGWTVAQVRAYYRLRKPKPGRIPCCRCDRMFKSQDMHTIKRCPQCTAYLSQNGHTVDMMCAATSRHVYQHCDALGGY